ncbi:glycosyltransferase [Actinotalea sp.]|uniref:glycosyltransferase n=1 Tax=Actinotalea sp. TaxID=1872145 RepID=UPI0035665686
MQVAVVSWTAVSGRARSTVRHSLALGLRVGVLDLDGSYLPCGAETVLRGSDLGRPDASLRRSAARLGARLLARSLQPALARRLAGGTEEVVLLLEPGVLLLASPTDLESAAVEHGFALVARDPGPTDGDGLHPDAQDLAELGAHHPGMIAVRADARGGDVLDRWAAATGQEARWLDVMAAGAEHGTLHGPAALLSAWTLHPGHRAEAGPPLLVDGRAVVAVDLSALDPDAPWVLDPRMPAPRARLSDHPALAELVRDELGRWSQDPGTDGEWDPDRTGFGLPLDDALRHAASAAGDSDPDVLDPAQAVAARDWLAAADGGPGPYLRGLHARPDLSAAFPHVPGADEAGFLAWARRHAGDDGAEATLLVPALDAADRSLAARVSAEERGRAQGRPRPGVNVIGFMGAELGIGESARLVLSALEAHEVPCAPTSVDRFSQSRVMTQAQDRARAEAFDTTVLCVNSDLTPTVAPAVADLLDRSYRIGMWYWEVEDFPATQHGGFGVLDEVWVATDFVRRAIEPHSPVPVRTLMPPLPQRSGEPVLDRRALGLPDRPYLLFSFDFLSTAERKNPVGLIEAFTAAFAPDEGPLLVIKSINAAKRPVQAERLRLAAAGRPDVLLLDRHLDPEARDALVAHCAGYVSLHRAEGLGLTMAEAMAWGRPVVATGYSGNLQFMTEENSFLVPWRPATVPSGAPPYPAGGTWADPDLDAAARILRGLVEEPQVAADRAARAAQDIATLHTPEVAGRAFAARLDELARARRARASGLTPAQLRGSARRLATGVARRLLG